MFFDRVWLPTRLATLASTTAAAWPSAASPAAKATALGPGARFVDVDIATVQLNTVETLDGLGCRLALHFDESEASRTPGIPVGHDGGRLHFAYLRKEIAELIFRRLIRQISDEYSR
jgi:hypothetical protein